MNRVSRLRIGPNRTVTFIFGAITVVKAYKFKEYTKNIKLPYDQALTLYRAFIQHGAERII